MLETHQTTRLQKEVVESFIEIYKVSQQNMFRYAYRFNWKGLLKLLVNIYADLSIWTINEEAQVGILANKLTDVNINKQILANKLNVVNINKQILANKLTVVNVNIRM